MVADEVPVSTLLLERLTALGLDVGRVLARAGLAAARFAGARPRLATAEFFALWDAIAAAGGAPDLGLRLGDESRPHQLDVASLAALSAPDLGQAIAKLGRYKRLVCPEEVRVAVAGAEAEVRFHWLLAERAAPALLVDGTFANLLRIVRLGTGEPGLTPRRLELTRRRAPAEAAMLKAHFGGPIRFDAPTDAFVLDAALLGRAFVTRNDAVLAALVPGLEAALGDEARSRRFADEVRAVLARRMRGERPSVDKVAAELHTSPRTLQRRLGDDGTSYQALLDEVRRATARRLLGATDLDAAEVAFLLGFEEQNSFARAFHAWEGTTPARWRLRQDR